MRKADPNVHPALVKLFPAALITAVLALPATVSVLAILVGSLETGRSVEFPPRSVGFYWLVKVISDPQWLVQLRDSFAVAFTAAALAVVLAIGAAATVRWLSYRLRLVAFAVFFMPSAMPSLLLAVGWYKPMQAIGLFDRIPGISFLHAAVALPSAVLPLMHAFDSLDLTFWRAAQNMGLTRWQATVRLALPASKDAALLAAALAFLLSFNEVAIALYLTQVRVEPVVRGIWSGVRYELSPEVFAVAFWILLADVILSAAIWRFFMRQGSK